MLGRWEHGTPDQLALLPPGSRPFSSQPDQAEAALYGFRWEMQGKGPSRCASIVRGTLARELVQDLGELDRELNTFADLPGAGGVNFRGRRLEPVQFADEPIEVLGKEALAKRRIATRTRQIIVGHRDEIAHGPIRIVESTYHYHR